MKADKPKLAEFLQEKFPNKGKQSLYRLEVTRVCEAFLASGLADLKFESELTSGSEAKYWSCLSEALVYDRIKGLQFGPRVNVGKGPDFLVMDGCRRIWLEVVCPEPVGIPEQWKRPMPLLAYSPPNDEILLRWASVIKSKAAQLDDYLKKGIVSQKDGYVIAVNGCMMRNGPISAFTGSSKLPHAVEGLFPIGALEFVFDGVSGVSLGRTNRERFEVSKSNGAKIPTGMFLNERYKEISAVWALDFNGGSVIENTQHSVMIHNPLATQPLPIGFFGSQFEFAVSSNVGEESIPSLGELAGRFKTYRLFRNRGDER